MKTQLLKALSSGQWSDGIRLSLSTFLCARHKGFFRTILRFILFLIVKNYSKFSFGKIDKLFLFLLVRN